MIPRDDDKLVDSSGKNGVTILDSSTVDKDNKKITIEFERPLDVSYDRSFYLQPEGDYKLFIFWGLFENDADNKKSRIKGMSARLSDGTAFEPKYNRGQKWVLDKPPGWDELQKTLSEYNPSASSANRLSLTSMLSTSLLALLFMLNFY